MPASHCVNKLHVPVQPKSLQLGEDVESGELLEVENLDVGHPDLVHQGDVNRDQRVVFVTKLNNDFKRNRKHKEEEKVKINTFTLDMISLGSLQRTKKNPFRVTLQYQCYFFCADVFHKRYRPEVMVVDIWQVLDVNANIDRCQGVVWKGISGKNRCCFCMYTWFITMRGK